MLGLLILSGKLAQAQTRVFLQAQAGPSAASLYKNVNGFGQQWSGGIGIRADSFLFSLELSRMSYRKVFSDSYAGRLSYENKIAASELNIRWMAGADWGLLLGYARTEHIESSYLYEEIVPGSDTATLQDGTLKSPEWSYVFGAFYIFPTSFCDFYTEAQILRTTTNQTLVINPSLGMRYTF